MATKRKPEEIEPGPADDLAEAADGFKDFLASIPAESVMRVTPYRMPSEYHPKIQKREALPPIDFAPTLDEMMDVVRRLYGPGKYTLYIAYETTLPTGEKKRRVVSPGFVLAPTAEDFAPTEPAPAAPTTEGALQTAIDGLLESVETKRRLMTLQGLQSLSEAPAAAPPVSGLSNVREIAEILRLLQPPQTDPLTMLRNAKELIAPPPDTLGGLDKMASVLERFGAFGDRGGGGSDRGGASGWDFAITLVKELGPMLGTFGAMLGPLLARASGTPGGVPDGPLPSANPPAPAVAPAPVPAAIAPAPGVPDVFLQAADGDATRAARLKWWTDLCTMEAATPREQWPDSFARAEEAADAHLPGFTAQLAASTDETVFQLLSALDTRLLNMPQAGEWVRGFVALCRTPAEGGM